MAKFWMQQTEVVAAGRRFKSEKIETDFRVEFDDSADPNVSEITLFNLSSDSIAIFKKGVRVILNAGYEGDVGTILLGFIAKQETTWSGVDKLTKLTVTENPGMWMNERVNKSYAPGVTAEAILTNLARESGMELGELKLVNNLTYTRGRSLSGTRQNIMKQIVAETGSKFHISHGKILIRPWNQGTVTGFLLNADTGLLESPEPFEEEMEGQTISGYKVKMLLNHRITVDSILQIQSKTANGTFRVRKGTHTSDFITDVEVI